MNSDGRFEAVLFNLRYLLSRPLVPLLLLQLGSFVLPWLATLYYSHKYGLTEAGEFSYILALLAPMIMLLASPSRNYLLSLTSIDTNSAFLARATLFVCGLVVVLVIGGYTRLLLLAIALYCVRMAEMLFDIPVAVQLSEGKWLQLWKLASAKSLTLMLAVVAAIFMSSIELIMFVITAVFIVVTLYHLRPVNLPVELVHVKHYIRSGLPLSISALMFSLHFNIPRYVLAEPHQQTDLAVYAMSSYLILPFLIVLNSFWQVRMPHMVKLCRLGLYQRFKLSMHISLVVLVAALLLQLGGLDFIYRPFWQLHNSIVMTKPELLGLYLQVIGFGFAPLLFSSVNYLLAANGQHKALLMITLFTAVICWALCYWGLSYYGSYGVVLGYALGCVVHAVLVVTAFLLKEV